MKQYMATLCVKMHNTEIDAQFPIELIEFMGFLFHLSLYRLIVDFIWSVR